MNEKNEVICKKTMGLKGCTGTYFGEEKDFSEEGTLRSKSQG